MANTTSRLALTQPVGTDPVSELRTSITGNATTLDDAALYQEGTLAARPTATAVAHGTFYRATDTGDLSWSNGTAWASVCQLPASGVAQYSSGTFAARPVAGVAGRIYYATDNGLVYQDTGSAWLTLAPVGAVTPVGTIQQFAAATVPADPDGVTRWHVCDGSAISRTTYSALFAAVSTTWGAGDGTTTFNIPDLRGRVPVGSGAGSGLTSRTLAQDGGAETHDHSVPGLSVPGLSVPSAGVTVNAHTHTLGPGYAGFGLSNSGMYWEPAAGNFPIQFATLATGYQKDAASGNEVYGTQLFGTTDADGASGSTAATTTGGGTTGTGTTGNGSTMPPFAVVTHIIKIL